MIQDGDWSEQGRRAFASIEVRQDLREAETDIFQHLHLRAYALQVLVILVFELRKHGVAVLTSVHQPTISLLLYSYHRSCLLRPGIDCFSHFPSQHAPPPSFSTPSPLRLTHIPRIRRSTPETPIHLPYPTPIRPRATAT